MNRSEVSLPPYFSVFKITVRFPKIPSFIFAGLCYYIGLYIHVRNAQCTDNCWDSTVGKRNNIRYTEYTRGFSSRILGSKIGNRYFCIILLLFLLLFYMLHYPITLSSYAIQLSLSLMTVFQLLYNLLIPHLII